MQLNTQFSWSNTYDRLQDKSSTQPCPSSHGTSWVLSDGQEIWSFHGYGRSHTILPHIHQPTTQPGSRTKSQHPQLGQTPPDIRQVCKWPPSPKKGRFEISLCQKRTHDRYPWAVLHLHSTLVYHLWHKVVKDLSWAEPAVSPLPCCSTEVENMYYWSHKVLTIMAANPVNSTDVGKLLTSPSLFTYNAKKTLGFLCSLIKPVGNWHKAFIPYSQLLMQKSRFPGGELKSLE